MLTEKLTASGKVIPSEQYIQGTPKSVWDKINNPLQQTIEKTNGDKITTLPITRPTVIKKPPIVIDQSEIDEPKVSNTEILKVKKIPITEESKTIDKIENKLLNINKNLSINNISYTVAILIGCYLVYKLWK